MEPQVLIFSFEEDNGGREAFSVFHCSPLVVMASEEDRNKVEAIIKAAAGVKEDETYDEEYSKESLINALNAAGYKAVWSSIKSYVNEIG